MAHEVDWTKSHNGLMLCRRNQVDDLMPEIVPILDDLAIWVPEQELNFWHDKLIDVKVHMLMPGQYPCIPNWHRDFTPRKGMERIEGWKAPEDDPKMYMWLSGGPLTEYRIDEDVTIFKPAQQWHEFTRNCMHRGTKSEEHQWRCFIRIIPDVFVHSHQMNAGQIRRHSQVYLSEKFRW